MTRNEFIILLTTVLEDNITEEISPDDVRSIFLALFDQIPAAVAAAAWGGISGTLTEQTDLNQVLETKADLGVDGKVLPAQLPDPPESQTGGIEDYNPLSSYLAHSEVNFNDKIFTAKVDVLATQAPPSSGTENAYWKELSQTHLQGTDTQIKTTGGIVVPADNIVSGAAIAANGIYDKLIAVDRIDFNLPGEFSAGDKLWQILSKLRRMLSSHTQSKDTITVSTINALSVVGFTLTISITGKSQSEGYISLSANTTLAFSARESGAYYMLAVIKNTASNVTVTVPVNSYLSGDGLLASSNQIILTGATASRFLIAIRVIQNGATLENWFSIGRNFS